MIASIALWVYLGCILIFLFQAPMVLDVLDQRPANRGARLLVIAAMTILWPISFAVLLAYGIKIWVKSVFED